MNFFLFSDLFSTNIAAKKQIMPLVGSHVCFGTRTNEKKIVFFWELWWFSVLPVARLVCLSQSQTLKCYTKRYNTKTIFMFLGPVFVCFGLSSDLLQAMTVTTAGNTLNRDNRNKLNPQESTCTQPETWNWSSWWNSAVVLFFLFIFFYLHFSFFFLKMSNHPLWKALRCCRR